MYAKARGLAVALRGAVGREIVKNFCFCEFRSVIGIWTHDSLVDSPVLLPLGYCQHLLYVYCCCCVHVELSGAAVKVHVFFDISGCFRSSRETSVWSSPKESCQKYARSFRRTRWQHQLKPESSLLWM